jgi:hypothetical protein
MFSGESLLITEDKPPCQPLFTYHLFGSSSLPNDHTEHQSIRVFVIFYLPGYFTALKEHSLRTVSIRFQRNETGFTSPAIGCQLVFSLLLEFYEIFFSRHATLFPFR